MIAHWRRFMEHLLMNISVPKSSTVKKLIEDISLSATLGFREANQLRQIFSLYDEIIIAASCQGMCSQLC